MAKPLKPAKTKTVRLPVTVVGADGAEHPPGTAVELDAQEADSLIARFGEVKAPETEASEEDGDGSGGGDGGDGKEPA